MAPCTLRFDSRPSEETGCLLTFDDPPNRTQLNKLHLSHDTYFEVDATPVKFVGKEDRDAQDKYLLAVRKPGNAEMHLALIPRVFHMRRTAVDSSEAAKMRAADSAEREGTAGEQKRGDLTEEFGASKAIKKRKKDMQSRVKSADVLLTPGSRLDKVLGAEIDTVKPEQSNESMLAERPLHPPFVIGATNLLEAYPLDGLIPPTVAHAIDVSILEKATRVKGQLIVMAEDEKATWPSWVLNRLRNHAPEPKDKAHEELVCLAYFTYLTRFLNISEPIKPEKTNNYLIGQSKASHALATSLRIPYDVWTHLCERFSVDEAPSSERPDKKRPSRRITPLMKQKGMLHALALGIRVSGGLLPHDALAYPLQLDPKKCHFYLRQLGCEITKRDGRKCAVLKLPLQLPSVQTRIIPTRR